MYRRVQDGLEAQGVDAFLVSTPANVDWLCGKERYYLPGLMLVTRETVFLLTKSRNFDTFRRLYPEYELVRGGVESVEHLCRTSGVRRLGFESEFVSWESAAEYARRLPGIELLPCPGFIEDLRMIKTPGELESLAAAVALSDAAYLRFLDRLSVGMTERQAKNLFRSIIFDLGADDLSFDLLVSSGPRTFLPHSASTDRTIGAGDLVLMDFGIRLDGYCSDTTRTVVMGRADERQKEIYGLVLLAQETALAGIKAGMAAREADALARNVIAPNLDRGCFDYGLGHGIGMQVHEKPRMHPDLDVPLRAGSVVSVEPGVYLEGWGGIRIEDLLVIGETCPGRNLTGCPKDLTIVG